MFDVQVKQIVASVFQMSAENTRQGVTMSVYVMCEGFSAKKNHYAGRIYKLQDLYLRSLFHLF